MVTVEGAYCSDQGRSDKGSTSTVTYRRGDWYATWFIKQIQQDSDWFSLMKAATVNCNPQHLAESLTYNRYAVNDFEWINDESTWWLRRGDYIWDSGSDLNDWIEDGVILLDRGCWKGKNFEEEFNSLGLETWRLRYLWAVEEEMSIELLEVWTWSFRRKLVQEIDLGELSIRKW